MASVVVSLYLWRDQFAAAHARDHPHGRECLVRRDVGDRGGKPADRPRHQRCIGDRRGAVSPSRMR